MNVHARRHLEQPGTLGFAWMSYPMMNGMFVFYIAGIAERRPQVLYGDEVNLPISTHPPTHTHAHTHTRTHAHTQTHTPTHTHTRVSTSAPAHAVSWFGVAGTVAQCERTVGVRVDRPRAQRQHPRRANTRGNGRLKLTRRRRRLLGGWVGCVMQHEMQQQEAGYHAMHEPMRYASAWHRPVGAH